MNTHESLIITKRVVIDFQGVDKNLMSSPINSTSAGPAEPQLWSHRPDSRRSCSGKACKPASGLA